MTITAPETVSAPTVPAEPSGPAAHLRDYHYPKVYLDLLENTDKHEMKVIREDGLYRHLVFSAPGTGFYRFDLITWPGHLAIAGDIGDGLVFQRTEDMLEFFDQGQSPGAIKADYWAEKIQSGGGRRSVKGFSVEVFINKVRNEAAEMAGSLPESDRKTFLTAVENDIITDAYHEHPARTSLAEFQFTDSAGKVHEFYDTHENNFTEYNYHYLLACHAILLGAKTYHAHVAAKATEPDEEAEPAAFTRDSPTIQDLIAAAEEVVLAATGQHLFRDGHDGSFTEEAGQLADAAVTILNNPEGAR